MPLNLKSFEVLTFDCYGTLIDWESGILSTLKPLFLKKGTIISDKAILEEYAKFESEIESLEYQSYKVILREIIKCFGQKFNFLIQNEETDCLVKSLNKWPPFYDTINALKILKKRFKLAILSNIDEDLIIESVNKLEISFDWIITAEQAKSYKPSLNNFQFALKKIGIPKEKILHVAQSIYHDIIPAKKIGLKTVWINRRQGKEGYGATPPALSKPDMELPNLISLASLSKNI